MQQMSACILKLKLRLTLTGTALHKTLTLLLSPQNRGEAPLARKRQEICTSTCTHSRPSQTLPSMSSITFQHQQIRFQRHHRRVGLILSDGLTRHDCVLHIRKRVKERFAHLRLMPWHLPRLVIKTLFEMCAHLREWKPQHREIR